MKNILITGATGNVGLEVIRSLKALTHPFRIIAGVRDIEKDSAKLSGLGVEVQKFDFLDIQSYSVALKGCDILFLLRPPQISDVKTYFQPLIQAAQTCGVSHIVFLSVQGVESSTIIPHHKIEKLIVESGIPYTFLRPAYFMQNFTTTLRADLIQKQRIFLPAGNARFTLVDVSDIGAVAAAILTHTEDHRNNAYDLTNHEKRTFGEMAALISAGTGRQIRFVSPNLLWFFIVKRMEKVPTMLILVMIMLHYLPRFQKEPAVTDWVKQISGNEPKTFAEFIAEHQTELQVKGSYSI